MVVCTDQYILLSLSEAEALLLCHIGAFTHGFLLVLNVHSGQLICVIGRVRITAAGTHHSLLERELLSHHLIALLHLPPVLILRCENGDTLDNTEHESADHSLLERRLRARSNLEETASDESGDDSVPRVVNLPLVDHEAVD